MSYNFASIASNTFATMKLTREVLEKILEKTKKGEIQWIFGRDGTIETRKIHSVKFRLGIVDVEVPAPSPLEISIGTKTQPPLLGEKNLYQSNRTAFQRIIYFMALDDEETILVANSLIHPELRDVLTDLFAEAVKQIGENIPKKLEQLNNILSS